MLFLKVLKLLYILNFQHFYCKFRVIYHFVSFLKVYVLFHCYFFFSIMCIIFSSCIFNCPYVIFPDLRYFTTCTSFWPPLLSFSNFSSNSSMIFLSSLSPYFHHYLCSLYFMYFSILCFTSYIFHFFFFIFTCSCIFHILLLLSLKSNNAF